MGLHSSWIKPGRCGLCCRILQRTVVYTRRKQSAKCHNGAERERQTVRDNCKCTKADFECDAGFEPARATASLAWLRCTGVGWVVLVSLSIVQRIGNKATDDKAEAVASLQNDMLSLYKDESLLAEMCSKYADQEIMYALSGYRRVPSCVMSVMSTLFVS